MWLLYAIKKTKTGELRDQIVSRLRPSQTYVIFRRGKIDDIFEAAIETNSIMNSEITDPKCRPEIRLVQVKSNKAQALVDEKTVGSNITLHDEDIIRLSANNTRFRVRWKDMAIFKDGLEDDDYHSMIKEASELGFHVTREWSKLITHVWISETPQTEISHALIKALMEQKYIITKSWLENVFLKSEDRKFDTKSCFESIKPIEWSEFGPLKKPAILSIDKRRLTLFKDMNFLLFDKNQSKILSALIKLGQGNIDYFDLDSKDEINIGSNTVFISPPEEHTQHKEKWETLKILLHERTGSLRVIQEVEIGYAIIYCSTEHMCNPVASLSSFNLGSLDCKEASDRNQCNSSRSTNVKIEDESNYPDSDSMATTVPYNIDSLEEENQDYNNSMKKHNFMPQCSSYNNTVENNDAKSPVETLSPIKPMSPIEPMSPIDNNDDDDILPSMPSLNNIFDDFDIKMKPLPPPRKPNTNNTPDIPTSITSAEAVNEDKIPENITTTITGTTNQVSSRFQRTSTPSSPNPSSTSNVPLNTEVHSTSCASQEFSVPSLHTALTSSTLPNHAHISRDISTSLENNHSASTNTSETYNNSSNLQASPSSSTNTNNKRILPRSNSSAVKKRKMADSFSNLNDDNNNQFLEENLQGGEKYTKVIYKPLVVNPSPPPRTGETSNGINYKKFKKVRQFENLNFLDVVNMVSSSQRVREQVLHNRARSMPGVTRLDDTEDFDPSLTISVPRRPGW